MDLRVDLMRSVKDLTEDELKSLIAQVVEDKLQDLPGNPDLDLHLRPDIQQRLHQSLDQPAASRRTVTAAAVARRLGLEW
jgi:hypothetical protein